MTELIEEQTSAETPSLEARLAEKDAYIAQLTADLEDAKTRLGTATNMEVLKEEVMSLIEQSRPTTPQDPEEISITNRQDPGPEAEQATAADLAEQVRKILAEENTKNTRESNVKSARDSLKDLYGSDYTKALEDSASALGVSVNFLTEMAARSPKGLVDLVKMHKPVEKKPANFAPPANSIDAARRNETSVRKNAAYYRDLMKTDRNLYLSKRVQAEMYREAMEQGAAFHQ